MDAGKLKEQLVLLELGEDRHWKKLTTIWGSATHKDRTNIFAKSGFGAATVEFIIRRRAVTLRNAISWDGKHCMITSVAEQESGYLKLTTAVVQIYDCIATRPLKITEDGKIRNVQQPLGGFEAILTEKYQHSYQEQPQTVVKVTCILVTPKEVLLKSSDIVAIGDDTYVVITAYMLATHCNEYEILDTREV